MGFFIDIHGNYYEGDRASLDDTAVSKRPSSKYKWYKEWVIDQEKVDIGITEEAQKKLNEIDLKSIRTIREYLTGDETKKAAALTYLKTFETQAVIERDKLKTK